MKKDSFKKNDLKIFSLGLKRSMTTLKKLYRELFSNARDRVSMTGFKSAIAEGNFLAIEEFFRTTVGFDLFQNKVQRSLKETGIVFGSLQSKLFKKMFNVDFTVYQSAEQFIAKFNTVIAEHAIRLTEGLREDAVKIVLEKVKAGREANFTVDSIVQDIKEHIPLSSRQSGALDKYKATIQKKGEKATEVLANSFSTSEQIKAAKKDLKKLSNLDTLVEKKTKQMIERRATTIARTEAGSFSNTLQFAQFQELQRDDPNRTYKKEWWCTNDDRSRDGHTYLLNQYGAGNGIPLHEPFQTLFGTLMHPQDPDGHPSDVIECRCKLVLAWENNF